MINLDRLTADERESYLYATEPGSARQRLATESADMQESLDEAERLEDELNELELRLDNADMRIDEVSELILNVIDSVSDDLPCTNADIVSALKHINDVLLDQV